MKSAGWWTVAALAMTLVVVSFGLEKEFGYAAIGLAMLLAVIISLTVGAMRLVTAYRKPA